MSTELTWRSRSMKRRNVDEFQISFDNGTGTYFPGQKVSGILHVNVLKDVKIAGVTVRFIGSCYVTHSKQHNHNRLEHYKAHHNSLKYHSNYSAIRSLSDNDYEVRKYYKDTEVYFDIKQFVYGSENQTVLQSGKYDFPFSMDLPINLPTSFEGSRGYVRYTIVGKIRRRQNSPLVNTVSSFKVFSTLDLNTIPNIETFLTKDETRNYGFLIFRTGSINVTVTINQNGFVPGQNIIINASIFNDSKAKISQTTAALISTVTYKTEGSNSKAEVLELNKWKQHSILPNARDEWVNVPLKVPHVPPTGLGNCHLINVEYFLTFTCECELGNIELTFPIYIGTVPLIVDLAISNMLSPARPAPSPPHHFHSDLPTVVSTPANDVCPGCSSSNLAILDKFLESEGAAGGADQENDMPADPPPTYEECISSAENNCMDNNDDRGAGQSATFKYPYV